MNYQEIKKHILKKTYILQFKTKNWAKRLRYKDYLIEVGVEVNKYLLRTHDSKVGLYILHTCLPA